MDGSPDVLVEKTVKRAMHIRGTDLTIIIYI